MALTVSFTALSFAQEGDAETNYPLGTELRVEIRRIDTADRKIALSERGAISADGEVTDYIVDDSEGTDATFDDVLKGLNRSQDDEDSSEESSSD